MNSTRHLQKKAESEKDNGSIPISVPVHPSFSSWHPSYFSDSDIQKSLVACRSISTLRPSYIQSHLYSASDSTEAGKVDQTPTGSDKEPIITPKAYPIISNPAYDETFNQVRSIFRRVSGKFSLPDAAATQPTTSTAAPPLHLLPANQDQLNSLSYPCFLSDAPPTPEVVFISSGPVSRFINTSPPSATVSTATATTAVAPDVILKCTSVKVVPTLQIDDNFRDVRSLPVARLENSPNSTSLAVSTGATAGTGTTIGTTTNSTLSYPQTGMVPPNLPLPTTSKSPITSLSSTTVLPQPSLGTGTPQVLSSDSKSPTPGSTTLATPTTRVKKQINQINIHEIDQLAFNSSSAILTVFTRLFAYPTVVVKTHVQTAMLEGGRSPSSMEVTRQIIRSEGFTGLLRGFAPSLLSTLLRQPYFILYEYLRYDMIRWHEAIGSPISDKNINVVRDGLAAGLASVMYQSFCNPIDVVVQRMMVQRRSGIKTTTNGGKTATSAVSGQRRWIDRMPSVKLTRDIYRNEGLMAFFRGFVSSSIQFGINSCIWYGSFSYFMQVFVPFFNERKEKKLSQRRTKQEEEQQAQSDQQKVDHMMSHVQPFEGPGMGSGSEIQPCAQEEGMWGDYPWAAQTLAAVASGMLSVFLTNPIDVCRTRYMVNGRTGDGSSFMSILKTLWKVEGPRALMLGVVPRMLSFAPVSAMTMTVFQVSKAVGHDVYLSKKEKRELALAGKK